MSLSALDRLRSVVEDDAHHPSSTLYDPTMSSAVGLTYGDLRALLKQLDDMERALTCQQTPSDNERRQFIRQAALAARFTLVPQYNQAEPGQDPPLGERTELEAIKEAVCLWQALAQEGY